MFLLFFTGTAIAVPVKISNHSEYTAVLNSIATVTMHWYGQLITDDNKISLNNKTTLPWINSWGKYRSNYPQNITQIKITQTQLKKIEDSKRYRYQFTVSSLITYIKNKQHLATTLTEIFYFKSPLDSPEDFINHPIAAIELSNKNQPAMITLPLQQKSKIARPYRRPHYKVRMFTYAWLAYLDGINTLKPIMNAQQWMKTATYSLSIGNHKSTNNLLKAIQQRQKILHKGGHLLRSLTTQSTSSTQFSITLILEWKGVSPEQQAIRARIQQKLMLKINDDGTWHIISIDEKHLLPITKPWMGLLC